MSTRGAYAKPLSSLRKNVLAACLSLRTLHQNIEDVPLLIHGPLEVVPPTMNREQDLIQMPLITWPGTSTAQLIGVLLAKLATPFPDRLVGHDHATDEQKLLYISVTEAEPVVQPHAMANDLSREAVVLISMSQWCAHDASIAHHAGTDKPLNKLTMPEWTQRFAGAHLLRACVREEAGEPGEAVRFHGATLATADDRILAWWGTLRRHDARQGERPRRGAAMASRQRL
jgi:hypothetical protein